MMISKKQNKVNQKKIMILKDKKLKEQLEQNNKFSLE